MRNRSYPIRILHVFSTLNRGGAETMIMNIYRNIDREKVQFDFLCLTNGIYDYSEEIINLGGRVFILNNDLRERPLLGMVQIVKIIKQSGPFTAVHSHSLPALVLLLSRLARVKKRISHVHSTNTEKEKNLSRKFYMIISKILIWLNATNLIACSQDAGVYFYGEKFKNDERCEVILNAIDLNLYRDLKKDDAKMMKKELGIPIDSIVIGHIGSYRRVKNHDFLINLASYLNKNKIKFIMVFVGQGELFDEVKNKVIFNALGKNVLMLGVRSDIPSLLNMFDVLLLPSLFEGIPVTIIEAQAACTRSILSNNVTREVDIGAGLVEYIGIDEGYDKWMEKITSPANVVKEKTDIIKMIRDKGYDVKKNVNNLYNLYGCNI